MTQTIREIAVTELQKALVDKTRILLDVRTDEEYRVSHLASAHIPLHELSNRLTELDPEQPWAVICRSGGRSFDATQFLQQMGFTDVVNVRGGFKAWALEIDPGFPVA